MGNSLGGKKTTKIMKINGETIKLKTPVQAGEVTKDYPGFVLLESESVKHFGIRAKPLDPHQELKSKRLYFLVELPKLPEQKAPRKVRSGINMGAKERLDSLMLARRSVSDLSLMKPKSNIIVDHEEPKEVGSPVRLKMRVPRAEVQRLMKESETEAEAAEKIMQLCLANNNNNNNNNNYSNLGATENSKGLELQRSAMVHPQVHWKGGSHGGIKPRQKRVGFLPVHEGEIQLAVA